jgi:hypothetical protein
MTAQHTQGPFYACISDGGKYCIRKDLGKGNFSRIGYAYYQSVGDVTPEEAEGNANLFAASPQMKIELKVAAQFIVSFMKGETNDFTSDEVLKRIDAVVAQAEGRS